MTAILELHAKEEGTYAIIATFFDENGDSVVPDAGLKWHLTDKRGGTINARQDVAIAVPAASNTIVLSGDDLAVDEGTSQEVRYLTIEGTFTGDLGAALPLVAECEFWVDSLIKIPS